MRRKVQEAPSKPSTPTSPRLAPSSRTTARPKACGRAEGAARALIFPNPSPRQDGGGIAECVPLRQPGTRAKKLAFPLLFPADERPHSYGRGSDHLSLDIHDATFVQNTASYVRQSVPRCAMLCCYRLLSSLFVLFHAVRLYRSDVSSGTAHRTAAHSTLTMST